MPEEEPVQARKQMKVDSDEDEIDRELREEREQEERQK